MKKKIVTMLLAITVITSLVGGCGGKDTDETSETTESTQEEAFENEPVDDWSWWNINWKITKQGETVEDESVDEVGDAGEAEDEGQEESGSSENVTVENLTSKTVEERRLWEGGSAEQVYVVEATVINKNDYCCDAIPTFSFNTTEKDNYGDDHVREILVSPSYSPYGLEWGGVSLAPNEKKDVRFYFDIETDEERADMTVLNKQGEEEYYSGEVKIADISNFQFHSLDVSVAHNRVYLPVNETDIAADLKEVDLYGEKGASGWGKIITGTITNNTADRWRTATIRFEFVTDDGATLGRQELDFEYVDRGDVIRFEDSSIFNQESYESEYYTGDMCAFTYDESGKNQANQAKLVPTLVSYEPDYEEE